MMRNRKLGHRLVRRRGLVVTEGTVTEPEYIDQLKAYFDRKPSTIYVKVKGVGKSPRHVVDKATELLTKARRAGEPYDWCCALVDVDQHSELDDCLARAEDEGKVRVLVTNPKFELWLLWHVMETNASQDSKRLDDLMAEHGILKGKHLASEFPLNRYPDAVARAQRAAPGLAACRKGPNPSSAMPVLLDLMTHDD